MRSQISLPCGLLFVAVLVLGSFCGRRWLQRVPTSFGYHHPAGGFLRQARRLEEVAVPYRVNLFLSLYYVNETLAQELELYDPTLSEVLSHFCQTVNRQQASGNQVNDKSQAIGATFETSDGIDYECKILEANRSYDKRGENLFGQGYFILEVAVEQVVYVASTNHLSNEEVTDIVKLGFNRGAGGRVKFFTLLQQNPAFSSVVNVEVFDGSLSTQHPSVSPSSAPTLVPSPTPTILPSSVPSILPSVAPTPKASDRPSSLPSTEPTETLSTPATQQPTVTPAPSEPPVTGGGNQIPATRPAPSSDKKNSRRPLILGAIAGGCATILVSCFFIFCVWYPFCGGFKDDDDSFVSEERAPGRIYNTALPTQTTYTSRGNAKVKVPGVVQLDDHQSIANTSIGDHSAGVIFRTQTGPRLVGDDGVRMLDSFEENSIYTSTVSQVDKSPSRTDSFMYSGPVDVDQVEQVEADNDSIHLDNTDPFFGASSTHNVSNNDGGERDEKPGVNGRNTADEKREFLTKGFDPFSDTASSLVSFGAWSAAGVEASNNSTHSSESGEARRIERMILGDVPPDLENPERFRRMESVGAKSESKNLSAPKSDSIEQQEASDSPKSPPRTRVRSNNNILLRTILEEARLLSESKSPSSKSRISRKSAPSRLAKRRSRDWKPSSVIPRDPMGDKPELDETLSLSSSEDSLNGAKSVGALPLRGDKKNRNGKGREVQRISHGTASKNKSSHATLQQLVLYSGVAVQDNSEEVFTATPRRASRKGTDPKPDPKPSTLEQDSPNPSGYLGAQPRQGWSSIVEEKERETPVSSPGLLGIAEKRVGPVFLDDASSGSDSASNPWLLDTIERTLGPRSPAADLESISGKSIRSSKSHHSGRSRLSTRSHESHRSRKYVVPLIHESELDRYLTSSPSSRPSVDPKINGQGNHIRGITDGSSITPRTLEHDLKRLEIQLADVLQPETDHVTTSSVSAASVGASRSTRASRITARRSNRKRLVVVVPPGKLGVVLADRHDGKGTVISEVRTSSAMHGMLSPGDKLVAIDGEDVTNMVVSQITSLMASRAMKERRLTVVTSSGTERLQETKQD